MKKAILLMACAFTLSLGATNFIGDPKDMGDKYCAKMKDGKMIVMHEDKEMMSDVTLANGTMIKTDGTIIKKDGTRMMMKDGECINKDGKMMGGKMMEKGEKKGEKKGEMMNEKK